MLGRGTITTLVWLRRTVLFAGWLMVSLVLLAMAALWWLTGTQSGVRWGLEQAQARLPLSVERVEGTLWRGLTFDGLRWQPASGPTLVADTLRVGVEAAPLWRAQLIVPELVARGVQVALPPADETAAPPAETGPWSPDDLDLPAGLVQLSAVRLESVTVTQADQAYRLETLLMTARLDARVGLPGFALALDEADLRLPDGLRLDAKGAVEGELAGDLPLAGRLEWLVDHPSGWLGGKVDLDGAVLGQLRLRPHADWVGADGLPASVCGELRFDGKRLDIAGLRADVLGGTLRLDGTVNPGKPLGLQLAGQGEALDPSWLAPTAPGRLDLRFSADLTQADGWLPLGGQVTVKSLDGELAGESLEQVTLEAAFDETAARLDLSGRAAGGELSLAAQLTAERALQADWQIGALPLAAALDEAGALALSSNGRIRGRLPDWREPLSARDWRERTTLTVEAFEAALTTTGTQDADRVVLSGRGALTEGSVDLAEARLSMPGGELSANGQVGPDATGKAWQLTDGRGELAIADLAALPWGLFARLPGMAAVAGQAEGATGRLQATVEAAGTTAIPRGRLQLNADDLRWAGHALERFRAVARIDGPDAIEASLEAGALAAAGNETPLAEHLSLRVEGRPDAHRITLAVDAAADVALDARGGWQDGRWQGRLTALDLTAPPMGDWTLTQAAPVTLDGQRQQIESFCLQPTTGENAGQLCLDAERLAESLTARLNGDLSLAALWRQWEGGDPQRLQLPGRVTVEAGAQIGPEGRRADLSLDLPADEIRVAAEALSAEETGAFETIAYPPARLRARLDDDRLNAEWQAALADWLSLRGEVSTRLADDRIEGNVSVEQADLQPLLALAERVAGPFDWPVGDIAGSLSGEMTVAGPRRQPRIEARLQGRELAFAAFPAGTEYRDGRLDVALDADGRLRIDGELTGAADTPPRPVFQEARIVETDPGRTVGRLTLSGEGRLVAADDWRLDLAVGGETIPLLRLPTMAVDARPDLQLALEPSGGRLAGTIDVPLLIARIEELPPSARSNSEDLVIEGEAPQQTGGGYPLEGDVEITLGEDVSLRGKGFATRLTGGLDVRLRPDSPLGLFGEVRMVDGRYQAYGQDLRVERGRLIFNGPPAAPGLDVVATREIRDGEGTVAGLAIQGELDDPQTEVFSRPAMSQSDALSLLLTGRRLSAGRQSDASLLMGAITALGVKQGDSLAQQINATLGFDEFGLESGTDGGTRLSVGKRIGDNLLVRYAVGVFTGVGELITRYRINRYLHLELTSAPESQSGDLIYQIDTGRRED